MNIISELGCIALTSILSIFTLFLLAKLIGNCQISELNLFDYINGITIGSIAAELATDLENWHQTLLALVIYGVFTFLINFLNRKSQFCRRITDGHSFVLYDNGTIYDKNIARSNIDINEFLLQCRCQGYFDLQDIQTAILECNGKVSILPKAAKRPSTPEDLGLNPTQDYIIANVVLDGTIMYQNLEHTGKDEKWLLKQLHEKGVKDIKNVLLATCSMDNQVEVYFKNGIDRKEDIFM